MSIHRQCCTMYIRADLELWSGLHRVFSIYCIICSTLLYKGIKSTSDMKKIKKSSSVSVLESALLGIQCGIIGWIKSRTKIYKKEKHVVNFGIFKLKFLFYYEPCIPVLDPGTKKIIRNIRCIESKNEYFSLPPVLSIWINWIRLQSGPRTRFDE